MQGEGPAIVVCDCNKLKFAVRKGEQTRVTGVVALEIVLCTIQISSESTQRTWRFIQYIIIYGIADLASLDLRLQMYGA